ncbi:MAG: histidine kinase [Microscillaceae bacterium]|nr:histidine kinase [Microscillaceae bacterium]
MFGKQKIISSTEENVLAPQKRCTEIDDRWLSIYGILIFSVLASILLTIPPRTLKAQLSEYVFFLIGTSITWYFNRWVIFYFRKRYPHYQSLGRRIRYQLLINVLFTFIPVYSLSYLYILWIKPTPFGHFITHSGELFFSALIFVLLINVLYECLFLFEYWQKSQLEAERYRKASLEAQYQNLKNQLNPHFLFNSFNTLSNLIEEDPQRALQFVEGLSDVYRYVLNSQKKDWIELSEEIKCMHAYLFLLKMRHEDNLRIHIHIEEKYYHYYIPPLSLQMLIENAIKHNEISLESPLQIQIFSKDNCIIVRNNLKLRKTARSSTQLGLKNIQQRYRHLSGKVVDIQEDSEYFMVHLPIVKLQSA